MTVDDLIDFTPELRAAAIEMVRNYKMGPLYTPPVVSTWPRPLGTLLKGPLGGANWPGGSFDPETGIISEGVPAGRLAHDRPDCRTPVRK